MQEVILVKLGEIVLKGLNRRTFEDRLLKNIRRRIARAGNFEVYSMQSTIYIEPKDEDADIDEAEERISKIFGVIGYARACVCEKDMDAITKMAPEYLNDTLAGFKTFKVESKRADKKFPLGSMEISREVGAALLRANPHISVDVHNPEITRGNPRESGVYPRRDEARRGRHSGGHGRQGGHSHQRRPRQPGGGVDDGKARRGADGHSLCEPAVHERART